MKIKARNDSFEIFGDAERVHWGKVKPFGNGARIDYRKEHIGKKVLIVLMKESE